ncbi:MAG TPA: ATP-binding cassette domain-containing protein [Candidatus Onthousia excrementipullorum]|uniref:ATP-binding cassette domain-containing protein n=1 Tax=Candidatus Onthousia excrementipullorum TaxID=2840884 RepID=A0A9D1DVU0_9FIRM|nr:ATP-binding cassette domain-containing protein [Candidatus Onthousia excrementipullorum]
MQEIVLQTNNLTKKYKDFVALDSASITIHKGDIYGLIGRNGAGKTTLMKLVTTLTTKSGGSFSLFGKEEELTESKRRIGCLIESPAFFDNLTAYQNLKYYSIQKGIVDEKQIDKVLKTVDLYKERNKKFKKFSLGMKQRLGIAFAILDNPDFIILDEPINGLDPIGIKEIRDTLKRLNEEEKITILISSHILSELYLIANHFCFIDKGRIIKDISKEELDLECSKCIVIRTKDVKKATVVLEKELSTTNYKVIDNTEIRLYDYLENSAKVNKTLLSNDIEIMGIYESGISLEDYFDSLIKEGAK